MKRITYFELLKLIEKTKQPLKIKPKFFDSDDDRQFPTPKEFVWNGDWYFDNNGDSMDIKEYIVKYNELFTKKCIYVIE